MQVEEVREGETCQDEEASQNIDDILFPLKIFLDLFQFIRKVKDEQDQGDQDKRKNYKEEEARID